MRCQIISGFSRYVKRHPFLTFVILAYAFSWWPWPLSALGLSPVIILGAGPFLAAMVVLGLTGGKPAVKGLLRQMVRWRVGLHWYAVALGLPVVFTGLAATLNVLLGAPAPGREQLAQWPSMLPAFLFLLLVPGIGGAWEEPGWQPLNWGCSGGWPMARARWRSSLRNCGPGVVSLALPRKWPQLTSVVVDIPNTCIAGREMADGKAERDPINYYPADFVLGALPPGELDVVLECDVAESDDVFLSKFAAALREAIFVTHFGAQ